MKTETGFDEHFITLRDDVQIRYFTAGSAAGKPVVLLHGGGTDHAMLSWRDTKTNYTPRLGEIKIPTLLIHGSRDIGVPLKYAQRAAGLLPNAQLTIIENAGHWTQRDYPEKVNPLIVDFLAG